MVPLEGIGEHRAEVGRGREGERSLTIAYDIDIELDAPLGVEQQAIARRSDGQRRHVVGQKALQEPAASGPSTQINARVERTAPTSPVSARAVNG